MPQVVEEIRLEIEGQTVTVERLDDGTFRKPDYLAGAEREVVGEYQYAGRKGGKKINAYSNGWGDRSDLKETAPATPAAQQWDGYGTALKPAWEPVIVAMKPRDGTFANNALEHGVAGLWIDGGRIESAVLDSERRTSVPAPGIWGNGKRHPQKEGEQRHNPNGRWPANVLLSHTPDCKRVGTKRVKGSNPGLKDGQQNGSGGMYGGGLHEAGRADHTDPDGLELVAAWDCVPGCPVLMLDEQSGEAGQQVAPGYGRNAPKFSGNAYNNGKRGGWEYERVEYTDSGGASRFYYCAKASRSERNRGLPDGMTNNHPTVKPLEIVRYLCRLTRTPTGGTVLDPFCGSGTTGAAAILEGRDFIGIDLDADPKVPALEIARYRCEWAVDEAEKARQLELEV